MPELEKDLRLLNSAIHTALVTNCELVKLPVTVAIEIKELLKAQNPVKPIKKPGIVEPYRCGACGAVLGWESEKQRFCLNCGRRIQWDD